jgi:transglutaminase-like putative cysteine protease
MAFPDLQTNNRLLDWIADLWQPGQRLQTYTLLQRLGSHISQTFSYQIREEPGVQNPMQTLTYRSGSCRDFAVLFMETARCLGLAARFVSGYLHSPPSATDYGATHAWVEVYLPGAGWRGFDPTSGEIVGSDHIAVAVARLPESIPPVAGSFFGTAVSSLDVGVWVTKC